MRIRIQYFSSLRILSPSGPLFIELKQCGSFGIIDHGLLQQERFYNIRKDVAMQSIRINNEDPDPGEPNQGRYAWTRNIVTNFKIFLQ
jgi:hypothetical protein